MTETPFDPSVHGWEHPEQTGYPALMGGYWTRAEAGSVAYGLKTGPEHANRSGFVHGGVILGLADQAMGRTALDAGQMQAQATMQIDVHFVAAPSPGDFLVARARVVRMARSVAFLACDIACDARQIASAQGIWKIIGG